MIRVLIERHLQEGAERALHLAMREMRQEAMPWPGYISGETLRDAANPRRYIIVSTWRSRADWDAWAASAERRQIEDKIAPLLTKPETATVLEPV